MASERPDQWLITCLKKLGGIAHLDDLYTEYGKVTGRAMDEIARAKVRQTLQTYSSDASWERPASAGDYFYSLDGVAARSGIWGLRYFAAQSPSLYPINELARAYVTLLTRAQTPLFNVRGIAFKDGRVHGIQVAFGPEATYPDRLLNDGRIEHIGEGLTQDQTATAGNRGMLDAIERQYAIPVFQYVASDRYAPLGSYLVERHRRERIHLSNGQDIEAFVFTLRPLGAAPNEAVKFVSDVEVAELTEEVGPSQPVLSREGQRALRTHLTRERDPGNREAVILIKGVRCEACDFHFGERYGPEISGYIEVHHVRPIAVGEYTPTIDDFAVLCANCHRAAHRGRGLTPRTVAELRALLTTAQAEQKGTAAKSQGLVDQ